MILGVFTSSIISSRRVGLHNRADSLECPSLHVSLLQSAFGLCSAALAALVGIPDAAPGQVSRWPLGTSWVCARAVEGRQTGLHLGACRLCRRGAGGEPAGRRTATRSAG